MSTLLNLKELSARAGQSAKSAIGPYLQWLQARYNDRASVLSQLQDDDVAQFPNNQGITIAGHVFALNELKTAIMEDKDIITDAAGDIFSTDEMLDDAGAEMSSIIVQQCALESLMTSDNPKTEFLNLIKCRLGEVSSTTSGYVDYVYTSVLSQDPESALSTLFSSGVPTPNPSDGTVFSSPEGEYSGINPTTAWLSTVDIDFSSVEDTVRTVCDGVVAVYNNVLAPLVDKAVSWVRTKTTGFVNAISNPIDVRNCDGWEELTFKYGVKTWDFEEIDSQGWASLFEKIPAGNYMCISTYGGTFYLSHSGFAAQGEIINPIVRYKPHMYAQGNKLLADLGSTISAQDYATTAASYGVNGLVEIREDSDEVKIAGLLRSTSSLTFMGIASIDGYETTPWSQVNQYYMNNPSDWRISTFICNPLANSSAAPTNADWIEALYSSINTQRMTESDVRLSYPGVALLLDTLTNALVTNERFTPYVITAGQKASAYDLACDAENAAAAGQMLTGAIVAVGAVALVAVGCVAAVKLKKAAAAAKRAYDLAYYDSSIPAKQVKKLKKKAARLSALSGTNFNDLTSAAKSAINSDNPTDRIIQLITGSFPND